MKSLIRFIDSAHSPIDFKVAREDPFFWSCYVAWIGEKGNTEKTARSYLSGIQTVFAEMGSHLSPPPLRMTLVTRALKGLSRQPRSKPVSPRLPITVAILSKLTCHFNYSKHEDRTIWAMMTLATYGLLRCGEITSNPIDSLRFPRVIHWRVNQSLSFGSFHLPISKSDTGHTGTDIFVAGNKTPTCPTSAMHSMLTKSPFKLRPSDPLFTLDGDTPISRYVFLKRVRRKLSKGGYNPKNFSGHSFRRGGAQSAFDSGLSIDEIQLVGRWKQVQVAHKYFGFTREKLQKLSADMASTPTSRPLKFELLHPDEEARREEHRTLFGRPAGGFGGHRYSN